jgi:putative membrane protein
MKAKLLRTGLISVVAGVLQASAFAVAAQQPPDNRVPGATSAGTRPSTDRNDVASRSSKEATMGTMSTEDFVKKAALDGMSEVALGKLAQQKSSNAEIKKFGAHMVKDHSAANEKLKAAANKANVEVPTAIDAEHQQVMASLQKLDGTKFDAAYSEHMQEAHMKAVALFESASQSSQTAAPVREFAQNTLPTLKEHHKEAQKLDNSANPATNSQ